MFRRWFDSLSFQDQLCWAFQTVPSRLPQVYWAYTLKDLKFKLRVAAGEALASHNQTFEALAKVVTQALGGGTSKSKSPPDATEVQSKDQMLRAFNSVFG